ncbi:hypothetical protein GUJ93_ZPchr0001g30546 [Zizania palustris]|uniref:HGWP repeat containing protein-like n=1 Tax=Zizania palustris TaxID=103762 RepID=A0A8J5VLQ9_ZIZPA|nr:hypothetical protein GUJ93_ZPchr0001g30546 [Zizania palustris]
MTPVPSSKAQGVAPLPILLLLLTSPPPPPQALLSSPPLEASLPSLLLLLFSSCPGFPSSGDSRVCLSPPSCTHLPPPDLASHMLPFAGYGLVHAFHHRIWSHTRLLSSDLANVRLNAATPCRLVSRSTA